VGEISIPIVEDLPMTEPTYEIHLTAIHGCWAHWIDRKEINEERSWVKLKAFLTNLGRRN